jgi:hypothetical protein
MKECDLKLIDSKTGRLHLEKTKLSGNARWKLKFWTTKGGEGGMQELARTIASKPMGAGARQQLASYSSGSPLIN